MYKKSVFISVPTYLTVLLFSVLVLSCTNTKQATYFYGAKEGGTNSNTPVPETVIQKSDILSIKVTSLSAAATEIFNQSSPATGGGAEATTPGYLVSSDGFIQFPILGNIKAEGLTKYQLRDKITSSLLDKKLLVDPIVSIRFQNFRVTVLGEVNHPTVVTVPNEKISLLEAIGLAGDLTLYARRNNVMVIREVNNQKVIERLDLNSNEIFTSPYYYLQSNDVVYVEPNKAKVSTANRTPQWLPILFSGLSLAATVATLAVTNK
jgi:polysaccharide biosynthesis/export protein